MVRGGSEIFWSLKFQIEAARFSESAEARASFFRSEQKSNRKGSPRAIASSDRGVGRIEFVAKKTMMNAAAASS